MTVPKPVFPVMANLFSPAASSSKAPIAAGTPSTPMLSVLSVQETPPIAPKKVLPASEMPATPDTLSQEKKLAKRSPISLVRDEQSQSVALPMTDPRLVTYATSTQYYSLEELAKLSARDIADLTKMMNEAALGNE